MCSSWSHTCTAAQSQFVAIITNSNMPMANIENNDSLDHGVCHNNVILYSNQQSSEVTPKRGLWQGFPLSFFLFIIC